MKAEKRFYEYNNGIINEMAYADTSMKGENIFLIYAENAKEAFALAMEHIYRRKTKSDFYDIDYSGHHYDVVYGVVCR